MTDQNSLVIFAKVIEASSFSEAARRLKASISTVSRRIANLENQLGVCLLERLTGNLRLYWTERLARVRLYNPANPVNRDAVFPLLPRIGEQRCCKCGASITVAF
jgi:hypothetical protein